MHGQPSIGSFWKSGVCRVTRESLRQSIWCWALRGGHFSARRLPFARDQEVDIANLAMRLWLWNNHKVDIAEPDENNARESN
ncbi:MAG: hypothetical protein WBX11_13930 [Thiobacillaceae bacterium]